jgi:biopolymer transport protein ExbD
MNPPPRVKAFDVWFVTANTVYKQVPYSVVADWTGQGRLARSDMVRPAGTEQEWQRVEQNKLLADYLPAAAPKWVLVEEGASTTTKADPIAFHEPGDEDPWPHPRSDEDDDVDMIPLIDISMVLLVFFIMMQSARALAPVDVPDMVYAGALKTDPSAITIIIDKASETDVVYSVRLGESVKPGHDNIRGPDAQKDVIKKMQELFQETKPPREVRIACRKDLPSERVFELLEALKPFKDLGSIASINAEVHEAKKE